VAATENPFSRRVSAAALQSQVAHLRCAVDDEACGGKRLEDRADAAVGVEVVRPGGAAAQVPIASDIANEVSPRRPSSVRDAVTSFSV
jgi:hypothetical protein